MRAAGLKPIHTVFETEAVLIRSNMCKHPRMEHLISLVAKRIAGVVASRNYVVCQFNCLRESLSIVKEITAGQRATTVTPLERGSWVAVTAMVEKENIAGVMDRLAAAGAKEIFTTSLDNCRV